MQPQPDLDIIKVDPQHASVAYEDSGIRIIRLVVPAGESVPMHSHPDRVVVCLSDIHVHNTFADPARQPTDMLEPEGTVTYSHATVHAGVNTGQNTWQLVEIELKGRNGGPIPP